MSKIELPNKQRVYQLRLTEDECKCIAGAMTGFFNVMSTEKRSVSPEMAMHITNALTKMKAAMENRTIVLAHN